MDILKKLPVVAAAILYTFGPASAAEITVMAYFYSRDHDFSSEENECTAQWDPDAKLAFTVSHQLPMNGFVTVVYKPGEPEEKSERVQIIGLCPEIIQIGNFTCILMLSVAAADNLGISEPSSVKVTWCPPISIGLTTYGD